VGQDSLSKGSLVFNLFPEEIFVELKDNSDPPSFFEVFNVHKMTPNHWSTAVWNGNTVQVQVVLKDWAAPRTGVIVPTLAIDLRYPSSTQFVGFFPLGLVAEKDRAKMAIGETRTMKIYTKRKANSPTPTSGAWLFNEDLPEAFIDDILTYGRKGPNGLYKPEDYGYSP
jgi:hypothetical protein